MKRWIALLLTVFSVLACFSSCGPRNQEDTPDTAGISSETAENMLKIAENGTVYYQIAYAPGLTEDVKESIQSVWQALINRSNSSLVLISEADPSNYDADTLEILIGDTSYPESDRVMESIGYGDWTIRFEGNKLVVASYARSGLRKALLKVIQQIKAGADGNGTIEIPADWNVLETEEPVLNELPRYQTESAFLPRTLDEGDNSCVAYVSGSSVVEYESYLSELEKQGYSLYFTNAIGDNRFATYINDSYTIHTGWYGYEKAARLVIEPKMALIPLDSENVWQPAEGVNTSLGMIGLDTEVAGHPDGGLGCIWQLADGSFIVIDGGYAENCDQLYEYMKARATGEKIEIAAWIITHQDGDHAYAFLSFCEKYKNEFSLELFFSNLPGAFIAEDSDFESSPASALAAKRIPGCKVIRAHTGMKFSLRDVEIEFLFTIDSLLPKPVVSANNSSLVFTITAGGERVIFTGDMGDSAAEVLVSMYGDYLKSDFLQIAHHGITNGNGKDPANMGKFYQAVSAEVCLWPCADYRYLNTDGLKDVANFGMNLKATKCAREVWIAGADRVTVFEFSYTPFSAYRFDPANPHPNTAAKDTASGEESLHWTQAGTNGTIERIEWSELLK